MSDTFFDLHEHQLRKSGEELCGDTIRTFRTDTSTLLVMSDGLGSGVKACILSTMTAEIILTMLKAEVPLLEVIRTVIGTLPICKVRRIAYATFTIVRIDHATGEFNVINFDNPAVFFVRQGRVSKLEAKVERILDREILMASGTMQRGDFLGVASDGVLHAGLGMELNFGWGWENISRYIEGVFMVHYPSAQRVVDDVVTKTQHLYHGRIGDDASFVGVYARRRNSLMVLTGPPLDQADDARCVDLLLNYPGRRVVCGGTTGTIVATHVGEPIETDITSMREDVPPIGHLSCLDLLTEGIFTVSRALEFIRACGDDVCNIPADHNGAVLLARELYNADTIHFVVGQKVNEFFQSPLLPRNMSVRRKLVEDLAATLIDMKKEVKVDYC